MRRHRPVRHGAVAGASCFSPPWRALAWPTHLRGSTPSIAKWPWALIHAISNTLTRVGGRRPVCRLPSRRGIEVKRDRTARTRDPPLFDRRRCAGLRLRAASVTTFGGPFASAPRTACHPWSQLGVRIGIGTAPQVRRRPHLDSHRDERQAVERLGCPPAARRHGCPP